MLIDRTGTFRGKAVESGVSLTNSGLPQFVLKCQAYEYWDAESGQWVDWMDVDQNETTAFLCLFSKAGDPIFHIQDVMKTFGWDGLKLSTLDELNIGKIEFQFTVEEHIYNEKTSLQVSKIAPYDAVPGSSIRKCDATELKSLDAKFAAALLKNNGGKKAVTAPAKPKTAPKAPAIGKKAAAKVETEAPPKTVVADTVAPAAPKLPPKRTVAAPPAAPKIKEYATAEAAWEAVNNVRAKDVTDEALATAWGHACAEVAADAADEDITPTQWGQIVEAVNKECAIF